MNRRKALKNLGLIAGGIILLPSCDFSDEKVSIILNKLQISIEEEKLLQEIVATILPEGEIPGAKSLKVSDFVWVMIDDMLSDKKQKSFMNGLKLFDVKVRELRKNSFTDLSENDKLIVLKDLLNGNTHKDKIEKKNDLKDVKRFLQAVKYYATWGFMQSEYIMTEIMPYQLVPGTYGSCETIETNKRINING